MADVEGNVEITVEGAGALEDAAEAARNLASALRDAEESASSISGAFESAARSLASLRDDAEEAAQALKSIRDAGAQVGDVAAGAETAAESLAQLRDEAAEAEAAFESLVASGPSLGDLAAFAEEDATALGHVRDEAIEAEAALDSLGGSGAGMAGDAASADALAASLGHVRDEALSAASAQDILGSSGARYGTALGEAAEAEGMTIGRYVDHLKAAQDETRDYAGSIERTISDVKGALAFMGQGDTVLVSKLGPEQWGDVITKDADSIQILGARVKGVKTSLDDLGDTAASRLDKLNLVQDFLSARSATDAWAESIRGAKDSLEEAGPAIKDAEIESSGLRDAISDFSGSLGPGFFGGALSGWRNLLQGAGSDLESVAEDAGDAGEGVGGFGESISSAFGPVTSKLSPMTGMIGGLIGLVGGLGPAFTTAGAGAAVGLGGFAALALPTLSKIESAYSSVSSARKTWTQAEETAQLDPTKTNLAAAASDATKLKLAYEEIPSSVRPVVQALGTLQTQYDSMAKSFQPEVLKVTGDALSAVSEGMSQFLKPAAELGGGLLDKGIKNLQTFMESPGAVKTFNDLLKETPGAVSSAAGALSSAGKFLGDAFGGEGLKGSESFIKSFDGFLKTIGPGVGTGIKGLATGLQTAMGAVEKGYPDLEKVTGALMVLEKLNFSSLKTQLGDLKGALGPLEQIVGLYDKLPKSWQSEITSHIGGAIKTAAGQLIPGLNEAHPEALHLPITIDPKVSVKGGHVDTGALEHQLAGGSSLPLPVKVEPKVDPAAMAKSLNLGGPKVPVPAEAKVDKADTSGLKGGDTKVPATAQVDKVDTSGINKAASNVKIHGVTVDLSDAHLSGIGALSSSLQSAGSSAGKSFDTGVASGISGGAGAATSAAQHVVTEIKAALSTLGAAGSAAGAALGAGLAAGIAGSTGAAVSAAVKMADEVTAAVKSAHETQSPSKVFKGIGEDDVAGLILALEGGKSQVATAAKDMAKSVTAPFTDKTITDTITELQTDLKDALKAGTISPTEETGISAWLDADNKRLMSLAQQRKTIEANITAADALYKSVDQATVQGANVVTFAGNVTSGASGGSSSSSGTSSSPYGSAGTPLDLAQQNAQAVAMANQMTGDTMNIKAPASLTANDSIQGQLQQYLSQTRAFTGDIKKLKGEGLDSTSLQQLLQAGVSGGGLSTAKMMLSGGTKGVQEIASLQKQISAAAKQLGTTGANATYESGSQIGEGLAQGLKSELGSVTAAIKSLASQIVTEMQKDLKIHSPSMVAWDMGSQFAAGMAGGITSGGPMVGAAAKELAIVASRGASGYGGGMTAHPMPIVAGGGGGAGGGSQTLHFHLEVGGQEIAQVVQTYTLQHARRNTGSGLQLSGRGT